MNSIQNQELLLVSNNLA